MNLPTEGDLVAISEREVLEAAKAWYAIWRETWRSPVNCAAGQSRLEHDLADAQCEVLAAVTLLESREQVRDQMEAEAKKRDRLLALMP